MGFLSSGLQKPKPFEYQPLYFDKEKEEREKSRKRSRMREKITDAEMPSEEERTKIPTFKSKFKDYRNVDSGSKDNFSMIRKVIILISIGLLIAIIYLVLQLSNIIINNV
ncbi:MAG: hypothetical protein K9J13_11365 [Saprospiraceae bacterium]|nr:hypothetical protein [Saprospiraceae bacterium]